MYDFDEDSDFTGSDPQNPRDLYVESECWFLQDERLPFKRTIDTTQYIQVNCSLLTTS